MHRRKFEKRDVEVLQAIYDGLDYQFDGGFPDFLSEEWLSVDVVVDATDCPFAVCGAKRAVEMVMVCDPRRPVMVRLRGIALLHEGMRAVLRFLGYREASAFIPPQIEKTHGRTMERRFGWLPAWKGYRVT